MFVFHDGADMTLRGNKLCHGFPVTVGIIEAEDIIDLFNALFFQLSNHIFVVDHQIGAAIAAPLRGIFTRSGGNDLHLAAQFRQRDRQRSDAACAADDQQRLIFRCWLKVQSLKQSFPGGQGRQRDRSGLRPIQALWLVTGNAWVNQLLGAVTARTGQVTRIKNFIAWLKVADFAAHFQHHTAGIPAEDAWLL